MKIPAASEYLKAAAAFLVVMLLAYLAGFDSWVRVALSAYTGIAALYVGILLYMVTGRREALGGAGLFSVGAALMALDLALKPAATVSYILLSAAIIAMVAAAVVLRRLLRGMQQIQS